MNKEKFDFNDFLIEPEIITNISSRSEVNPFTIYGSLPLITAPMDTVVDLSNLDVYVKNKINVTLPRGLKSNINRKVIYESMSLDKFIENYLNDDESKNRVISTLTKNFILIDIANGHMQKLLTTVVKAKLKYGSPLYLMVGNVANPKTYLELAKAGADAIRCGIGNGNSCSTTQQLGIGYPMGSLISECYQLKKENNLKALIVADGGMKTYSDIIKALALGSDLVMVGSIFNKALESCGETKIFKYFKINPLGKIARYAMKHKLSLYKRFRGMSTKEVQKIWGNKVLKTSEGVIRVRKVEYTLNQWVINFEDYLRSAMSYTNSLTLDEFRGNVKINFISEESYNRFKK